MTSASPARKRRPAPPGTKASDDIAAMIRVDHAGEYGAVRIYEGQLAVLGRTAKGGETAAAIRRMAQQEQHHLKTFDALINERCVRPTALEPVWRLAGFALGAATALMGEKAAMACTAAVEEVIDSHYADQLTRLGDADAKLAKTVREFRADEIAHREAAIAHGAEEAPGYQALTGAIKAGCRLAIALSTRI
ncbi:MAG: demethoxyubiquinone hydroxylase family protein [Alphaproteobacteria bacterium]|nr:demethoxyubiquinone hydroxylase family protein [Alphaproteobacteria bacterium]